MAVVADDSMEERVSPGLGVVVKMVVVKMVVHVVGEVEVLL